MKKEKAAAAAAVLCAAALLCTVSLIHRSTEKKSNVVFEINNTAENKLSSEMSSEMSEETAEKKTTAKKSSSGSASKKTSKKSSSKKKSGSKSKSSSETYEITEQTMPQFPLELNAATAQELMFIDGIGEVTAARIIAKREELGFFRNRKQLLEIDGIGEKTLESIWEYIYIENEEYDTESFAQTIVSSLDTAKQTVFTDAADYTEPTDYTDETDYVYETDCTEESTVQLLLDINTAEYDDIMMLPGMTEELCENILALREEIMYFSDVHEILYAEGMNEKYYAIVEKYLFVDENDILYNITG